MSESSLSKNIAAAIRKRGGWARKTHGGPVMAGWPDVVGVYRGYALWWEVKLPDKEKNLTVLQAAVLEEAGKAGAIARVITSVAQGNKILDAIDRKKDGR